jgi:hypothetical protein
MADLLNFIGFKTLSRRIKNSFSLYSAPFALLFAFVVLFGVSAQAQEEQTEEQVPENLAPPAIKIISKEEKSALASISDIKNRTKLTVELMEARLKKAESLNAEESFSAILNELGGFQALMNDALSYINRNGGGGKMLDTFKRFEMALRAFTPRIELIRREMPDSYGYHVKRLLISVRDARSKAVAPLFSTTVVPNNEN